MLIIIFSFEIVLCASRVDESPCFLCVYRASMKKNHLTCHLDFFLRFLVLLIFSLTSRRLFCASLYIIIMVVIFSLYAVRCANDEWTNVIYVNQSSVLGTQNFLSPKIPRSTVIENRTQWAVLCISNAVSISVSVPFRTFNFGMHERITEIINRITECEKKEEEIEPKLKWWYKEERKKEKRRTTHSHDCAVVYCSMYSYCSACLENVSVENCYVCGAWVIVCECANTWQCCVLRVCVHWLRKREKPKITMKNRSSSCSTSWCMYTARINEDNGVTLTSRSLSFFLGYFVPNRCPNNGDISAKTQCVLCRCN